MIRVLRILVGVGLISLGVWSGFSLTAYGQESTLSGTITATATSAAAGIGWSWGRGTLTLLDGSEHSFRIRGLSVVAVGFRQTSIVGNVHNLRTPADLAGTYVAGSAGITVGGGAGGITMRNEKGVVINAAGTGQGINLSLAASGVTITMQE